MKINLVRIDDRLIHGQVATVWSKEANAQRIIICSDEVAKDQIRKRVEKVSSIERIRTNVEKEVGDAIREEGLSGVKVDEDYKRYYPYSKLCSKVCSANGRSRGSDQEC